MASTIFTSVPRASVPVRDRRSNHTTLLGAYRLAVAALPADQRTVLSLAMKEKLTHAEIADVLAMTPRRVTQLYDEAIDHLRSTLTPQTAEADLPAAA